MAAPQENLNQLGLTLPQASAPGGSYESVNIRGHILYMAIQLPIRNGEYFYQGVLGDNLTTDDGYKAMQMCALNVLAQIKEKVGFDRIAGLNHMDAYYRATQEWDESPKVVNGASDLFLNVLEEQGKHSRAIFGVHDLPRSFCAGITTTLTLRD